MHKSYGENVIFQLTKHDILVCSKELEIPGEQITDDVSELVRKRISLSFGNWPEVVNMAIIEAIKCPLGLVCYPSCYWWKDGKCAFPGEREK